MSTAGGKPVQLSLAILAMVPRIPRATARSVPPADFGPAIITAGIGNVACREGVSRSTALRMLKRTGPAVLQPPAPAEEKGPRPCPANFRQAYIEHGRDECEVIFHASHQTVTRWLNESGRRALVKARAAFVAQRRAERRKAATPPAKPKRGRRGRPVAPELAAAAANYLRAPPCRVVVLRMTDDSVEWYVDGKGRMPASDMLKLAKAKGFTPPPNLTGKRPQG